MNTTDSKPVSIKNWHHCPYRGLQPQSKDEKGFPQPPLQIPLDERCPPTLMALPLSVELGVKSAEKVEPKKRGRPKAGEVREVIPVEIEEEVMLIPILQEDTYCFDCVGSRIREREMGVAFSQRKVSNFSPEKRRGRPPKRA